MDGENNGSKPYEQMDDLGGKIPRFFGKKHPQLQEFVVCGKIMKFWRLVLVRMHQPWLSTRQESI